MPELHGKTMFDEPVDIRQPLRPVPGTERPAPKVRRPASPATAKAPAEPVDAPRPKRKTGRPRTLPDEKRMATQVFLNEEERAYLVQIGEKGNMSDGVRKLIEAHRRQMGT